jgi:hypothetical protein
MVASADMAITAGWGITFSPSLFQMHSSNNWTLGQGKNLPFLSQEHMYDLFPLLECQSSQINDKHFWV